MNALLGKTQAEAPTRNRFNCASSCLPWASSGGNTSNPWAIASADNNGLIKLWRLERGRQGHLGAPELLTLRQHQDSVDNLQFSPDGSILASGSADGTVRLWPAK